MATFESSEKPRSPLVSAALIPRLLAFIVKRREAWRAGQSARTEHIISKGLSAIE
jgi:hypothetical protein